MKKLFLTLLIGLASITGASGSDWSDMIYNRVNLSYQNIHYGGKNTGVNYFLGEDGVSLNGFGVEGLMGLPLSTKRPMDIEVGLQFQAGWGGLSNYAFMGESKFNTNLFRINIPLQYIYHFNCGSGFRVSPLAGIDFRFNVIAKETLKTFTGGVQTEWKTNYFNDKDMGGNKFKRFQLGWHVGLALEYRRFVLSATYGTDFMPIWSEKTRDSKISTATLGVGFGWYY